MTVRECYEKLDADYEDIVLRLGDDAIIERFLLKYPSDASMQKFMEAYKQRDVESMFQAVHTLKGVVANMSFTRLYECAVAVTEQLRPRTKIADAGLVDALIAEYDRTMKAIKEYESQK